MNLKIVADIASFLSNIYFLLAERTLIYSGDKFPVLNIHLLEIFGIFIIIISNSPNCTLYIHAAYCM